MDGDVLAAEEAGADDAGADDEDELADAEDDAGAEVVVVEAGDVAVAVGVGVGVGDALAGCDVAAYVGALDEE